MKNQNSLTLLILILFLSCNDEQPEPGPVTNPPPLGTTDLRTQYKVSTLTSTFNGSGGAAVDANGFIYVADFGNALNNADGTTVTRVDPQSGTTSVFATGFNGASGNAFDSQGNLIQSNIRGDFVSKVTPDGTVSVLADIGGNAGPVGVAIDQNDQIFVCNCNGNFIAQISPSGELSVYFESALLRCPNGLTIDSDGNLYIANFADGKVFKLTPELVLSEMATLPGNAGAHMQYRNGLIYAIGRNANQIFTIAGDGEISIIAGTGARGDADGGGEAATFFIPNGIALSPDGQKIYVVDKSFSVQGSQLNPVMVRVIEKK